MLSRRIRATAALLAALTWAVGAAFIPATASALPTTSGSATPSGSAAPSDGGTSDVGWTVDQATAAVSQDRIVRIPGAPAVLDTAKISAELQGTSIHILLLPFAPLDDPARSAGRVAGARP